MIRFVSVLLITTIITGCSPFGDDIENYAKSNRYSSCIERLSNNGNLDYDEIKEVCGEYLK